MIETIKTLGTLTWKDSSGMMHSEELKALEFEPETPGEYPVILFLHGHGERGSDLQLLKRTEIPQLFTKGFNCPYKVLCPQMPTSYGSSWNRPIGDKIMTFLATYNAPSFHITGLSMGGIGTANFLAIFSKRIQEAKNMALATGQSLNVWFSTAGIVCGTINDGAHEEMKRIPIRCWHGTNDTTVRPADVQKDVPILKAYGADIDLIMLPGVAHDAWNYAYNPTYDNNYWNWIKAKVGKEETVIGMTVFEGSQLRIKTETGVYLTNVTKS